MATDTTAVPARNYPNPYADRDGDADAGAELARVFAAGEKFEERQRRTRAAVVLESEEVLVWWAMERDETVPLTRLFFERQLAGYHNPDTSFLNSTSNLRHSSSVEVDNDMKDINDIIDVDDNDDDGHHQHHNGKSSSNKNKTVDKYATQGSSSKSLEIDDERLYEDPSLQSPQASGATAGKQQKQKQRLNDLDDEMSDDEDTGGVGIGGNQSAVAGASAGSSRKGNR